jgi:hypothetical protein
MPPKKSEQLKRAAADLDEALNESPVKKKKSRTDLGKQKATIVNPVLPPPEVDVPDPSFLDRFEPEAALRLTKAANSINYAEDKINLYADLLSSFDNGRDERSLAIADRTNGKIQKWGERRAKIQKTMDVLMDIAPKKKPGALISAQSAEGFLSSSGKFTIIFVSSRFALAYSFTACLYTSRCRAYVSLPEFLRIPLITLLAYPHSPGLIRHPCWAYLPPLRAYLPFPGLSAVPPGLICHPLCGLSAVPPGLICHLLSAYLPSPLRLICHPLCGLSATYPAYLPPVGLICPPSAYLPLLGSLVV